jgi:hypothetical protein
MPSNYADSPELASLLEVNSAGELIPELCFHGLQGLMELHIP